MKENKSDFILFKTEDEKISVDVRFEDETVWLTQDQMAKLFERDRTVIVKHIANIFTEGELEEKSNLQFLHIANSDKPVKFFNLNVISKRLMVKVSMIKNRMCINRKRNMCQMSFWKATSICMQSSRPIIFLQAWPR